MFLIFSTRFNPNFKLTLLLLIWLWKPLAQWLASCAWWKCQYPWLALLCGSLPPMVGRFLGCTGWLNLSLHTRNKRWCPTVGRNDVDGEVLPLLLLSQLVSHPTILEIQVLALFPVHLSHCPLLPPDCPPSNCTKLLLWQDLRNNARISFQLMTLGYVAPLEMSPIRFSLLFCHASFTR